VRRFGGLVVAACLVAALLIAASTPAFALANGEAATSGQFPYAVKLLMTNIPNPTGTYNSACSDALISPPGSLPRSSASNA
jgi:hypothetical protein